MRENDLTTLAQEHLEAVYGDHATFKEGQLEAITAVLKGQRALVIQKTGWGKSLIYFLATRIMRNNKAGMTIVISPLLALMNNQIESAALFGLNARTMSSSNIDDWKVITKELLENDVDILFVAPERLANETFSTDILSKIGHTIGMLVIDEAHCISDWGHDFRPDYRRIINIIKYLPPNVPLLATTATANNRVIDDIIKQLGEKLLVQRGSLVRESLAIQVIQLDTKEERLAWLSETIPILEGIGIIYCLTKNDCNLVCSWLRKKEINAYTYFSGIDIETRMQLEKMFIHNEMKVLVATTAFGMGIDKPDIHFVIHFQKPGNVVSYYQQIGRAGRGIKSAFAVLLAGNEDSEITTYFIKNAFPTYTEMDEIIKILMSFDSLSRDEIISKIDISHGRIENCLKFLTINGDVGKAGSKYYKTPKSWKPDLELSERITKIRFSELKKMDEFIATDKCYMKFVANELNDNTAIECKKCSNCMRKEIFKPNPSIHLINEAVWFTRNEHYIFEARKKWPSFVKQNGKNIINIEMRCETGRVLSNYGDAGWGRIVSWNKYKDNYFTDELVDASAKLLKGSIIKDEIKWVTSVPSIRHPELVRSFAVRLAKMLDLPYIDSMDKIDNAKQQKELHNEQMQYLNAWNSFEVKQINSGNLFLIDDMVDSKWTFTVCSYKLLENGSGKVYPFALANTAGSGGSD